VRDKLNNKMKYVWPSDSSILKQRSDIEKFNKGLELREKIREVQNHINVNLDHGDIKRRKTATVCYLIDHLKFRVGDEKDEDEADTVGASTLRPEHIAFYEGGRVVFDFLGKDSIRQYLEVVLPPEICGNLKEFAEITTSTLFDEVDSKTVSGFLDEVMEGLSAKVFRTYYASKAVESELDKIEIDSAAPDYVKKHAALLANLEAAIICNHKRNIPKNWEMTLERQNERLEARREKARENIKKHKQKIRDARNKYRERRDRYEKKLAEDKLKLEDYKIELKLREEHGKSTKGIMKRIASKKRVIKNARKRIRDLKQRHVMKVDRYRERMRERVLKDQAIIEKQVLQIDAKRKTRDYNLNTSLKSYIDPRIYYKWGEKHEYDWKNFYSNTLCRKFSWIEEQNPLHTA
jgi:DNA topoisomerase-1